jgi:signal-transduction protein with cAMP-binding, CBS, and nucleotidyltransferase domain
MAAAMVQGHIHRVVVTEKGRPVGIVSSMDLLKLLAGRGRG